MTIWISRELSVFHFECLDMWCAWIGHPREKLWPFEFFESFRYSISSTSIYYVPEPNLRVISYDNLNFSRASVVQFRAPHYSLHLNLIYALKVATIWISRELPLFNFERLDWWCTWIWHPSEELWPFKFFESFRCSISGVLIYYAPESDLCLISYDHMNF